MQVSLFSKSLRPNTSIFCLVKMKVCFCSKYLDYFVCRVHILFSYDLYTVALE
jgi:hypothetical protein